MFTLFILIWMGTSVGVYCHLRNILASDILKCGIEVGVYKMIDMFQ